MAKRITGLAKLIGLLKAVCKTIALFRATIRTFVPEINRTAYDTAMDAILAACEVIMGLDYQDEEPGTEAPWGN